MTDSLREEPAVADRRFIAHTDIFMGAARAYSRGQTVEADAVEANDWQDYVVPENSSQAREIKAAITGRDPADFDTTKASAKSADSAKTEQKG
jgi:hypothetical protein